jgi:hypothetical protein
MKTAEDAEDAEQLRVFAANFEVVPHKIFKIMRVIGGLGLARG